MVKKGIRNLFGQLGFQIYKSENVLYIPEEILLKAYMLKAFESMNNTVRTIFDIGANIGNFTRFVSSVFPDAEVFSFEPVSANYSSLKKNSVENKKVHSYHFTLGSHPEQKKKLFLKEDSTWHSLANNDSWVLDENNFEYVTVETVDRFMNENSVRSIDILKTDTEGYDLEVLKGAEKALSENRIKMVICEVGFNKEDIQHTHFSAVQDYLFDKGFRVFGFTGLQACYEFNNKLGIGYCNCLFLNSDK
jgi:FkbM family methyltransferase